MSASQAIANSSELEDASYSWVTETDTPKSVDDKAGQTTSQTEETAGKQAGSTEKTTSDASEKKNTRMLLVCLKMKIVHQLILSLRLDQREAWMTLTDYLGWYVSRPN